MDCCPPGSSVHGDSSEKNTGVGCHAFLQGIFPTQGLNPGLPHCRWILYHLSYQGSPRILEWVAFPFSRESSQLRSQTRVSCISGGFFTSWATREATDRSQYGAITAPHTWWMIVGSTPFSIPVTPPRECCHRPISCGRKPRLPTQMSPAQHYGVRLCRPEISSHTSLFSAIKGELGHNFLGAVLSFSKVISAKCLI